MKKYFFILLLASMPTTGVSANENLDWADRKLVNQIFTQGKIIDKYSPDGPRHYTIVYKKKIWSCSISAGSRIIICWSDKRF